MYNSYASAVNDQLPAAGKQFLKDLKARTGKPSEFYTNGDPIEAPITIYRIVGPGCNQEGRVVDRVITARTAALPYAPNPSSVGCAGVLSPEEPPDHREL